MWWDWRGLCLLLHLMRSAFEAWPHVCDGLDANIPSPNLVSLQSVYINRISFIHGPEILFLEFGGVI